MCRTGMVGLGLVLLYLPRVTEGKLLVHGGSEGKSLAVGEYERVKDGDLVLCRGKLVSSKVLFTGERVGSR